ncbi:MAG TPA: replicative DNA helicase [Thermoanaerobaculia bacterium]|jgi:replicative DNA helicase|nr:replicative DNA helicase [Thermoanaerobaculia bacterium]HSP94557.1 replicative DNA helicase [Thermoanaerobaculia bacterium]
MLEETVAEKGLPQNAEAERAVLGSILLDPDSISLVVPILSREDFFSDKHQRIYRGMLDLFDRSSRIDLLTLKEELNAGTAETVDAAYLSWLLDGVPDIGNVEHYARIVKEKATLRRLIRAGQRIVRDGLTQDKTAEQLLSDVTGEIFDIADDTVREAFTQIGKIVKHNLEVIEDARSRQGMLSGLATGFTELDRMTSGLQASDLIILAARPSVGKTSLALNIAQHVALREAKSVGFFSLEMSMEQLGFRVLCSEADVDAKKVRDGFASKEAIGRLVLAQTKIAGANFFIDDSAAVTVPLMRAKAQRLQREKGLDLIFVDYLQLMAGHGRFDNRTQEVSQISRGLKLLAKELKVPIVALSQLSRQPEKRTGDQRKPQLADLRDSGSLEQDADVVIMLYREELYERNTDRKGLADVIIAKQRNGPTGDFELVFLPDHMTFHNYAREAPPPATDQPF